MAQPTQTAFYQSPPRLTGEFNFLKKFLARQLSKEFSADIFSHLEHVSHLAATTWNEWAWLAETHPPKHIPFDPWGKRIDEIQVHEAWKKLEEAAAVEGIVATAYEKKYGSQSRLYQMALLYLYAPSSAFFSCPLAMTDGAARAIELYGDEYLTKNVLPRLISRDPKNFWTSGQWMTEKTGGSDVGLTSTMARKINSEHYLLTGDKWFTSATTSQMTMTLARPEGAEVGSRGLSLFYLQLRKNEGALQGITVHRLKDKLGTRALPTAELSLNETPARLVGGLGGGVKKISSLFNITRIYNSVCSVAHMRRALDLIESYSHQRVAFGKKISEHPLHRQTLLELENIFQRCFFLTFLVVELLSKEESGESSTSEKILLRALTPIAKLYTAKKCVRVSSEVCEMFGGAGFVEDTRIPYLLRDAQVFPIWEGTTNILTLDFLRALDKEEASPILVEYLKKNKKYLSGSELDQLQFVLSFLESDSGDMDQREIQAKKVVFSLAPLLAKIYEKQVFS